MLRRPFFRQLREQFCSERGVLFLLLLRVRLREINVRLVGVVHERHELKIFAVRERVELVRVALRAAEREAEPRRTRRRDAVRHRVEAELVRIDAALLVEHRVAVEAGRDFLIERRAREHVSRDLLDRELIERLVGVQRIDDPVAIRPDRPRAIFLVAVRVRIAREVEPLARPAFAVARRGEEAIDPLCHDCVARGGRGARVTWCRGRIHPVTLSACHLVMLRILAGELFDECVLLRWRRRDAHEVEVNPAAQRGGIGLG